MPPSSDTSPKLPDSPEPQPEYTLEERSSLLQLAHDAILAALENRERRPFTPCEHLSELRGAFTTVYSNGQLRGCVGYPTPVMPLYRTVIETAQSAAFDDPRFVPVTLSEAQHLQISISVLSPVKPIHAEDVVVARDGLIISQGLSWSAAAPGSCRARLGPHHLSRTNLQKGRPSTGRMEVRREHRSVHSRGVRRS